MEVCPLPHCAGLLGHDLRSFDLVQPLLGETAPCRRRGEATACCLAITHIHLATDLPHHVDHLIHRNRELDSCERHLDCRKRNRGACSVPEYTWQLHQAAKRIADEAERALHGERRRVAGLARRSAQHLRGCTGGHSSSRARLRLTSALCTRKRCALSDHCADEDGGCECIDEFLIGDTART